MCSCIICKKELTARKLTIHFKSKICISSIDIPVVRGKCKFCNCVFDGTFNAGCHVKWCLKNPDKKYGSGSQMNTLVAIGKRSKSISIAHQNGCYVNASKKAIITRRSKYPNGVIRMSRQYRENARIAALKSKHQRVSKRSHQFVDKRGRTFTFDSSWEDITAIRLDELDIKWDRPAPIQYRLGEVVKNYFPDFYLIDYNLYLDPKNPYVEDQQKDKLRVVSKLINLQILRSAEECKNFQI
jgi:hypothetical protein